jgi:hypothetical protein
VVLGTVNVLLAESPRDGQERKKGNPVTALCLAFESLVLYYPWELLGPAEVLAYAAN